MISIHLLSLYVEGFRSFLKPTLIEFKENGLTILKGYNQDTGGSSAAGKSSLMMALAYNIGYCNLPATELKTWGNDQSAKTIGIYICSGKKLKIERSSKLLVWIDDVIIEGSILHKQKIIEEVMGCSSEILELLTYRPQKTSGLFLNKTDVEKKEFLTKILKLDIFEENISLAEVRKNELQKDYQLGTKNLEELTNRLSHLQQRGLLEKIENSIIQEDEKELKNIDYTIEELKIKIFQLEEKIKDPNVQKQFHEEMEAFKLQIHQLNEVIDEFHRQIINEKQKDLLKCEEYLSLKKEEFKKLHGNYQNFLTIQNSVSRLEQDKKENNNKIEEIENLILQKKTELEILKNEQCFACKRSLDSSLYTNLTSEKLKEIEELYQKKMVCEQFVTHVEETVFSIQNLCFEDEKEYQGIKILIKETEEKYNIQKSEFLLFKKNSLHAYLLDSSVEYQSFCFKKQLIEQLLSDKEKNTQLELENNLNALKKEQECLLIINNNKQHLFSKIQEAKNTNQKIGHINDRFLTEIKEVDQEILSKKEEVQIIEKELQKEIDFLSLINKEGFLGFVFDEILQDISNEANTYLAQIPNVNFISVQFVSEVLTQKGNSKRNIKPIFFTNVHEVMSWRSFSGGQMSSIDLAIELAIHKVLCQRIEHIPGWLIFDEIFEGQDLVTKEACLELLKEFSQERLIIIIDHANEFKEMFENQILITSKNGYSFIGNN